MMMQMLGAFAKFERAMVRERTRAGLDAARARGRVGGRRPKLGAEQRAEVLAMLEAGRPAAEVARVHRVHRATVGRLAAAARLERRGDGREAAGEGRAAAAGGAGGTRGRGGRTSARARGAPGQQGS